MTALGKILVFVNLVFSLLTAGLITMVFITRTNWKNGYDQLEKRIQVLQADIAAESASKSMAQQQMASGLTVSDKKTVAVNNELDKVKAELAAAALKSTEFQRDRDSLKTTIDTQKAESQRLIDEQKTLSATLVTRDGQIVGLKQDVSKYKQESTQYELAYQSAKQNSELLLQELTEAKKVNRLARANGNNVGPTGERSVLERAIPPAEDVRGTVTQITNNLAMVSVGTDVGVTVGTKLQLFRQGVGLADPIWLGELKITSAQPKMAVGTVELALRRNKVQVGDEVASSLTPGR